MQLSKELQKEKGYVVCLLKYMLGAGSGEEEILVKQSANNKTVCLGYFGRVDVAPVYKFEDYMCIAATNTVGFVGSRKQLLLYPLDEKVINQIERVEDADDQSLPFRPKDSDSRPSFCCLSILNINQLLKDEMGSEGIHIIAKQLSDQLAQYVSSKGDTAKLAFAVMGLLGTEDICIILLSSDFPSIAEAIDSLRGMTKGKEVVIQNSHSVLMMDQSGKAEPPQWGETKADIHFSLKTEHGLEYLKMIQAEMEKKTGTKITLESQIGEYDAVIHCPAKALNNLYGSRGPLSYSNKEYRVAVYQSETVLYQEITTAYDCNEKKLSQEEKKPTSNGGIPFQKMETLVSSVIRKVNGYMLGNSGQSEKAVEYIRLSIYRLLKDFMRMASIPFGRAFQYDQYVQFCAAISAIELAAKKYSVTKKDDGAKEEFDRTFSKIVNALSNSMQAASQVDRLSFEEQQSHLQNTGAYHKVLLAYYGIVKDILSLLYGIERDNVQSMLIPLIAFGHAPIIFSHAYHASFEGKPAELICITLPYQALYNIPKHIGPLIHEIFHYASPANREIRNAAAGRFLVAEALQQFFDNVGFFLKNNSNRYGQEVVLYCRKGFLSVVDQVYNIIYQNQMKAQKTVPEGLDVAEHSNKQALASEEFFRTIRGALVPYPAIAPYSNAHIQLQVKELYCEAWRELRKQIFDGNEHENQDVVELFALNQELNEEQEQEYISNVYQQIFPEFLPAVESRLSAFKNALKEIPPDLFDIGFIMRGATDDLKARQYLWQIYSIRCSKLYYTHVDEPHRTLTSTNGNTIRIGMMLDYLVFGLSNTKTQTGRGKIINDKLSQWFESCEERTKWQSDDRRRICISSADDYAVYQSESLLSNIMLKYFFQPITEQIEALSRITGMADIMQRLSRFYEGYYSAVEEGPGENRARRLFDLEIEIIEFYQKQPGLVALANEKRDAKPQRIDVVAWDVDADVFGRCETEVRSPSDLSLQITKAYSAIVPENTASPLWFRGQRRESWALLPGIMREGELSSKYGFLVNMRKMLTLAKAKILPRGETFHDAEWLAFLQHNGFKTSLLDWSEDLHSALFFAIEKWMDKKDNKEPEENATIAVFNPVLFNLAQNMLEKHEKAGAGSKSDREYKRAYNNLCQYLKGKPVESKDYEIPLFTRSEERKKYEHYFRLQDSDEVTSADIRRPIAAMTPANSERMKAQAGAFVFFDVHTRPDDNKSLTYNNVDLYQCQRDYFEEMKRKAGEDGCEHPPVRPFLYKLILNRFAWKAFVNYVRAIGIRKYKMYPEIDKLAEDISREAFVRFEKK